MRVEHKGVTIDLEFDAEGFPEVTIDTGCNYLGAKNQPIVSVEINNVMVFDMFDESGDSRWS